MEPLIVGTHVLWPQARRSAVRLVESLRTFGGARRAAPVWIQARADLAAAVANDVRAPGLAPIVVSAVSAPEGMRAFPYAEKPYAAAQAERAARGAAGTLVWVDSDAVFLGEPRELLCAPPTALTYCPVMHNRSGVLIDAEPNAFWQRIYRLLELSDDLLFPMTTPADQVRIRAYFHCGLLAVVPERGILARWQEDFERLARDPKLTAMCAANEDQRIFLHQAALTGAVLRTMEREEMRLLSERYNYPLFFERRYATVRTFDSLAAAVVARCLVHSENPEHAGPIELEGPREKVAWLQARLP